MNNSISFSTQNRKTIITKMEQELFDVIVIGGGITGSGIALDAISRGLNVALIERKDFASGTSSRSGKLIHGGLKYLQNFDFPVVKETGSEREIVYNNALHLVYPIKMNFPLIKNESYNLLTLKAGLTLYDRLAGVKKEERHRIYGKKKTLQNEPLFNPNTVKGSGVYVEYRTDDSRLTMEVAKTAAEKGAQVLNYAEMTEFLKNEENIVKGIVVKDHIESKTFTIYGKHIVNAAGPWVDVVRKKDRPVTGKYMVLAKGIHIVFNRKSLPVNSSIYFQHKGRMIAVIPIGNRTYVGSTESTYKEDMDDIHVNLTEVHYLLGCLKDMFPNLTLSVSDVISSWAGIRPLIGQEGKSPAELSRHDEIFESDTGLITIAGGKLTGYRKMAERVMQYIEKKEKKDVTPSKTDTIKLSGSQFNNQQELESYAEKLTGYYHDIHLDKEDILNLVYRYGSNTDLVLQSISSYKQLESKEDMAILGELRYTVEHEMVTSLVDFYDRRTSYLLFEPQKVTSSLDLVSDELAKLLSWTPEKKQEEKRQLYYAISKTHSFK
ncbi:glycerol-3-phosphate dehydrogenase/oxidase [Ornithinibacillus sp. BX22]|uniref:Glycerol-3-phosphate dehydrogenase n=2 Tax=Ornithinibacillus TaxID=484508 RepID=A0A923RK90_9BACI|nr:MULTISPECIES: glycerol-3-phosphate dehydrogenase/oxidase [Ornithinibacillus]MBC5638033.1 glycerol-3-phosphate dehydrogenase/oxidase [Ornithinibacillus hominis]MBS3681920.1 glycerol-3-phosphate dehydrogenase/oxidase [Ornithinibacillus massiliensis]